MLSEFQPYRERHQLCRCFLPSAGLISAKIEHRARHACCVRRCRSNYFRKDEDIRVRVRPVLCRQLPGGGTGYEGESQSASLSRSGACLRVWRTLAGLLRVLCRRRPPESPTNSGPECIRACLTAWSKHRWAWWLPGKASKAGLWYKIGTKELHRLALTRTSRSFGQAGAI